MSRHLRQVIASVVVAAICVVTIALPAFAVPSTNSPSETQREELIQELMTWSGDAYMAISDVIDAGLVDELSFGSDVVLHKPSDGFLDGVVTENLSSEIVAWEYYVLLPLEHDGATVGMIAAMKSLHGDYWYPNEIFDGVCAAEIAGLQAGDRVMQDAANAGHVWFAVRGEEVIYLEDCSREPDPLLTTLVQYQQYVLNSGSLPGKVGGGNTANGSDAPGLPATGGNSATARGAMAAVIVLCIVGAVVGARRL